MNQTLKGALFGVIAAIAYGTNPLFSLPLYEQGLTTESVLLYRFVFAALFLGIILKIRGESLAIKKREILPLLLFGFLFSMSSLTLYRSFHYMDAGIACTILFVYPVMVAVIMAVFFREKASLLTYGCIALAMIGIALLYKGDGQTKLSTVGLLLVVISSLAYAIYIVGVNRSSIKNMPAGKMTFWTIVFGSLTFVVGTGFFTELQPVQSVDGWLNVLGVALIPTVVSILFINISIKNIGATYAAIIGALEPVTALVIGVFVFDERMTARIALGAVLILVAVSLIVAEKPLTERLRRRKTA